jgi:hypothetical protein
MRTVAGCERSVQIIRRQGHCPLAMVLVSEMSGETMRNNAGAYANVEQVGTHITKSAVPGPTLAEFFEEPGTSRICVAR